MKISRKKLDIILARRCKSLHDLRDSFATKTLVRINNEMELNVKTVGKLSALLNCDPTELIKEE